MMLNLQGKKKATEETLWFQDPLRKPSDTLNEPVVEQRTECSRRTDYCK